MKTLILLGAALFSAAAESGPTAETLKVVLTQRLAKLKPADALERNVLFQSVLAGRPDGSSYPFRVTALIRDYGAGYPRNRYYGQTCVGLLNEVVFTLTPDAFGGWNVQGAMTPPLDTVRCQANPADGVTSIPLASLQGTVAPRGSAAPPPAPLRTAPGAVAPGSYECWANGQARMLMNFTVRPAAQYTDSEGKTGTYAVDASGRIAFRGGMLDGVLPNGFYGVYLVDHGRPKVSFRNASGNEVTNCEWTK
jgi:hypothetical protein